MTSHTPGFSNTSTSAFPEASPLYLHTTHLGAPAVLGQGQWWVVVGDEAVVVMEEEEEVEEEGVVLVVVVAVVFL